MEISDPTNFECNLDFQGGRKSLYQSVFESKIVFSNPKQPFSNPFFAKRIITSRLDDVKRMGGVFRIIPACSIEHQSERYTWIRLCLAFKYLPLDYLNLLYNVQATISSIHQICSFLTGIHGPKSAMPGPDGPWITVSWLKQLVFVKVLIQSYISKIKYIIDEVQLENEVELILSVKSDLGWIWSFGLKFETSLGKNENFYLGTFFNNHHY